MLASALLAAGSANAKIIYVDGADALGGDGKSWATSFKYLRDALSTALAGDSIYLAKGTYYPDDSELEDGLFGDRELSFDLAVDDIKIYGGFVGTETNLTQRDPAVNLTTLSGKIWGASEDIQWSLHVVKASESSTLDGVTVEGGNANGSLTWTYPRIASYDQGGGCYLSAGKTLTLRKCTFTGNTAREFGGAIKVEDSSGKVVATSCKFEQNSVTSFHLSTFQCAGGAIDGNVTATDCTFSANTVNASPLDSDTGRNSSAQGGAISGDVTALRCQFTGNTVTAIGGAQAAIGSGGAISGSVTATKCVFSTNSATAPVASGGAINGGKVVATNSVFFTNISTLGYYLSGTAGRGVGGGGAIHVGTDGSTITNSVFVKNTSGFRGGAVCNIKSLVITNSTFLDNGVATGFKGSALSCADIGTILNNVFWNINATGANTDLSNLIHVVENGVLRNTDVNYPTPASLAQNVVKGGIASITDEPDADRFLGVTSATLLTGDPLFVNAPDPDGTDNVFGTADDGLRIKTGSSAIGTAQTATITYKNFVPKDVSDIDEDGDVAEFLPADIASYVRVQSTYVDMGAYEFGDVLHSADIEIADGSTVLTDNVGVVDFGNAAGTTVIKTFTVRNMGTANLTSLAATIGGANASDFRVIPPTSTTVLPGNLVSFGVAFTPTVNGARTATIQVASNDPDENPFDIAIKGTAFVSDIAVEQPSGTGLVDGTSSINFGTVAVLSGSSKTFVIRNLGQANLNIASIVSSGSNGKDFKVSDLASTVVVPGSSTTFKVICSPSAAGSRNATITINSNDPDAEGAFSIKVLCNAIVAPEISLFQPSTSEMFAGGTKSYGSVKKGLAFTKTFTIKNTGSAVLKNISVSLSGSSLFSKTNPAVSKLQPGEKTTFTVTFKPTSLGKVTTRLRIVSNDANENPFDTQLDGTGVSTSSSSVSTKLAAAYASSVDGTVQSPVVSTTTTSDGTQYLVLTVEKSADWALSKHTVQVSSNLLDWFSGDKHTTTLVDDAKILKVRDNTPVKAGAKRYIRLK